MNTIDFSPLEVVALPELKIPSNASIKWNLGSHGVLMQRGDKMLFEPNPEVKRVVVGGLAIEASGSYTIRLPTRQPRPGEFLFNDGNGNLAWKKP